MLTKKMNLQFFAEDPPPADSNPSAEPSKTPPTTSPTTEPKLFSEDYVKSLRSEAAENRVKARQMKEAIEKVFGIEIDGDITEALTAVKVGYETKLADTQKSVRALHLNTEAAKLQAELGIIDLEAALKLADLSDVKITEDGKVATRARAWIEMSQSVSATVLTAVATRARAWIEILCECRYV